MHVNKNIAVIAVIVCLSMVTACFEKVPVKELSLAKNAITEAESVKADYYAKDEYAQAKDLLLKAHDNVKNEEYDKAKQNAIDSQKKAREAYNKALPLLAKDTRDIATQSLKAADDAYASVLAKDDYVKASDMLQEANRQYENKNYLVSYKVALEADIYAKNARNVAMNQKETLADSIKEVNIVIEQAEGYGAAQYAPEKLALAQEYSATARAAYDAGQLKKGFSAIEVAKLNADDAYFTALKATAAKKIEEAQAAINTAKGSEAAKTSPNDIKAAEESLEQAKSLFTDAKYKESMIACGQAISIAQGVSSKKAVAVTPVIEQGNQGVVIKEDQNEAIQKKVDEETEYMIYKVKYTPAKRDCLWRIAEKFYNDGFKWKLIYDANRDKVKNPDLIKPGWTLKIPKAATKVTQPTKDENKETVIQENEPPATELKMKTE
ncbi:MAG: LysM peptidoglycan-binding domain-containing protein [Spirochaetota bacterium]